MSHIKKLTARLDPKRVAQRRVNRRTIMKFSEDNGLVYFGRVHHQEDEHHLVRGLTLSNSHRDSHYAIGSTYGYDVTLVERTDALRLPGKSVSPHRWLIFAFDLHATAELPHIFIGHNHHSQRFYELLLTKFSRMQKITIGTFGNYDTAFSDHYSVFTEVAASLAAERLFNHEVAKVIATHFGSLSIEVSKNCLYIYTDQRAMSINLLDTMLKNGLWLASSLDKNAEHL